MSQRTKIIVPSVVVILVIGTVVILSGLVLHSSKNESTEAAGAVRTADRFEGGTFEASGVAHVAGTQGVLFVDDGRPDEVMWMQLDGNGKQTGLIKAMKLGVTVDDPEGITTDGSYFYVVGSQSGSKGADQAGLVRFRFNPETQGVDEVQSLIGLRRYLVENVALLGGLASRKNKDTGIDIEGLAWDPNRRALLLGLRSPVVDGSALIIPLKMRDPAGRFSFENIDVGEIEKISLGGMGIRGFEYDNRQRVFHIIAGATDSQDKTDFKLWVWNGHPDGSGLRETNSFDRKLQPEGVAAITVGENSYVVVVFDTSRYLKLQ